MSDIDEDLDLSENGTAALLTFAKSITRNAGEMLRKAFETPRSAYDLKSATDPVTATDKAIEAYIFSAIRAKYPSHKLLGEESASEDLLKDVPTWIIDPLDGTANFVHRIPHCAVSVALSRNRRSVIGVVYNPMSRELFEATHMSAAQLNGCTIRVSQVSRLAGACVVTEAGADRNGRKVEWMVRRFADLLAAGTQCVRMSGSCALNLTAVACGRVDVLYERGPYAWDVAAGVLIVERAGGVIKGGVGEDCDFELDGRSLLAYTPTIADELASAFTQDTSV